MNPLNLSLLQIVIALVLTGGLVAAGRNIVRWLYSQSGTMATFFILAIAVGMVALVNALAN